MFCLKTPGHDADELDNADSMQMVWFPSLLAWGGTPYRHIILITPPRRRLQKNSSALKSGEAMPPRPPGSAVPVEYSCLTKLLRGAWERRCCLGNQNRNVF